MGGYRRLLFALLVGASASPAVAAAAGRTLQQAIGNPTDLSLSGSLRLRYEALGGQPRVGIGAKDDLVAIRTTLAAEYRPGALRIGAELYDSRAYFAGRESAVSANDVNTLEFVQAYVGADIDAPFGAGTKASVQLGRFVLNLGSRRLVAADDYRNTTNGYTGIRAELSGADGTTAVLIYTLPQRRLPEDPEAVRDNEVKLDRESFDLRLWGGLLNTPALLDHTAVELGYFRLQERDSPGRPTRNRNLHSVDLRLIREPAAGKIDYEAEFIYQFGHIRAGTAPDAELLDVSAWFLHADMGYRFPGPLRARVSAEYDFGSGDGSRRGFGRFDTLFGMRRADFSPSGIYAAISRSNISTPGLRLEVAPNKRLDAFLSYRAMWLANARDAFATTGVQDRSGASGRFAGHQIDARLRYWLVPDSLRLELNGDLLLKGRFLKNAPNAPRTGDTRYGSISLLAEF